MEVGGPTRLFLCSQWTYQLKLLITLGSPRLSVLYETNPDFSTFWVSLRKGHTIVKDGRLYDGPVCLSPCLEGLTYSLDALPVRHVSPVVLVTGEVVSIDDISRVFTLPPVFMFRVVMFDLLPKYTL